MLVCVQDSFLYSFRILSETLRFKFELTINPCSSDRQSRVSVCQLLHQSHPLRLLLPALQEGVPRPLHQETGDPRSEVREKTLFPVNKFNMAGTPPGRIVFIKQLPN